MTKTATKRVPEPRPRPKLARLGDDVGTLFREGSDGEPDVYMLDDGRFAFCLHEIWYARRTLTAIDRLLAKLRKIRPTKVWTACNHVPSELTVLGAKASTGLRTRLILPNGEVRSYRTTRWYRHDPGLLRRLKQHCRKREQLERELAREYRDLLREAKPAELPVLR